MPPSTTAAPHLSDTLRLELFIDAVSDYAICTFDANGFVTSWNAGAERIKQRPERFVEIEVADHRHARHEQPLPRQANEGLGHRPHGARARQEQRQPGEADLETLMQAVAGAWPGEMPSRGLAYDGASLSVALPEQWGQPQVTQLSEALQSAGFAVEQQGNGQITVRRAGRG